MKFARHVVAGLAAVLIVALAIANRGPVEFSLSPVPITINLPLYQLLLAVLFLGVIAGGGSVYVARLRRWRRMRTKTSASVDEEQLAADTRPSRAGSSPFRLRLEKFRRDGEV